MSDYMVTDTDLTGIANAIRAKSGGSSPLVFPTGFVSEIGNIPTGTEPSGIKYIWSETDGPGGWDVGGYKYCSVDGSPLLDGHYRLWVDFTDATESHEETITIGFNRVSGSVLIDWGDGTTPVTLINSSGAYTLAANHTYTQSGLFIIDISQISGTTWIFSFSNSLRVSVAAAELTTFTSGHTVPGIGSVTSASDASQKLITACIRNTLSGVPSSGFERCASLNKVIIENGVSSIGNSAFRYCASLMEITAPSSITNINNYAFQDCSMLQKIHMKPTTPPTLGSDVFYHVPASAIIYVPTGYLSAYQSASGWSSYASKMQEEPATT